MKQGRKSAWLLLVVMVLVFSLTACKKDDKKMDKTEESTEVTSETKEKDAQEEKEEEKEDSEKTMGKAGVYDVAEKGFHGDISVSVEVNEEGKIVSVEVKDHKETEKVGTVPVEKIPAKIVEEQSLDVDKVSGATVTTNALVRGVANALEMAGFDPKDYGYKPVEKKVQEDKLDYTIDKATMPEKKEKTGSVTITDAKGREVTIDLPISSYAISTMDVIDYIIPLKGKDAFSMLVGAGQDGGHGFNKYAQLYVPTVGNYLKHTGQISDHNAPFDLEMLLSMEPDVLIVNSAMGAHKHAMAIEEQLKQIGTKIVLIDVPGKSIDKSVQNTMEILGKIFQEEDKAKEVSDFLDEQYQLLASKNLREKEQPRVYYEKSGYSEVFGSTSTSKRGWGQVIDVAGGKNIADELLMETAGAKGASNTLDPEYVIDQNPDYIVLSGINDGWLAILGEKKAPSFDILNRNGWKDLQAVKDGKVYEFAHATSRSIYAFYPSLKLAKIFYPEEFKDLDPEAKLEEFFDRFMILDSDISNWFYSLEDAK